MNFAVSFSGGKDSFLAMQKMMEDNHELKLIFTTFNGEEGSWFHDINKDILIDIANNLETNFETFNLDANEYKKGFVENLKRIKEKYNLDAIVFGDIDIEDHKKWCDLVCTKAKLEAIFPLWKIPRMKVVEEFINKGNKAIIKRVNKNLLNQDFLGKTLSYDILNQMREYDIDLCGENGEYHTLVYSSPIFKSEINIKCTDIVETENSYLINIENK